MSPPLLRRLALTLAVGLSVAGAGLPSSGVAQGRSLRLDRFHADLVVRPDGAVVVTETLRPRFTGQWNGVYRNLSLQHRTAKGVPTRLDVEILSVTDGEGNALEVDHSTPDAWTQRMQIWVPDAVDATRTVVIRYRVDNAIRFFDDPDGPGGVHDELYWNVTGNAWEIPIDRASVEVTLPPGATVMEAWAYTGPEGSTAQDATVTVEGARVEAVASSPLAAGDGLTISVSFPEGFVPEPGFFATAAQSVRMWWPAGLPVLALLGMLQLWRRHGRDPKQRAITVQYEPPPGLTPAEAGTLVDHKAQMHDLTSTLVDLAVQGWVRIEETVEKRFFGLSKERDYRFHLLRPREAWSRLLPHERRFLGALFHGGTEVSMTRVVDFGKALRSLMKRGGRGKGELVDEYPELFAGKTREELAREFPEKFGDADALRPGDQPLRRGGAGTPADLAEIFATGGALREETPHAGEAGEASPLPTEEMEPASDVPLESVDLSELENRFYKSLSGIRNAIYDRLVEQGHYRRRPDQVKGFFIGVAIGLAVLGAIAMGITAGAPVFVAHPGAILAGFGVSGGVVLLVGLFMPARTVRGARAREAALGFKEFLKRVEEPRFKRMIRSPRDFERYLPYAMAFRVEGRWAKAFEDLYTEPPDWYVGSNPGRGFHASDFTSDLNSMTSHASSTFSSSPSSSGSGGGGSSGGGSGGGGGGGF